MISRVDLKTAIYKWLTGLTFNVSTPGSFIWLDQNFPRPALPYVGMRILNEDMIHNDEHKVSDTDGAFSIEGDREFDLRIEAYGIEGFDIIREIRDSLEFVSVNDSLHNDSVTFVDHGQIIDLSEQLDTIIENRYSLDIRFRTRSVLTDPGQGVIETVNTEGTYKAPDLSTITITTQSIS